MIKIFNYFALFYKRLERLAQGAGLLPHVGSQFWVKYLNFFVLCFGLWGLAQMRERGKEGAWGEKFIHKSALHTILRILFVEIVFFSGWQQ